MLVLSFPKAQVSLYKASVLSSFSRVRPFAAPQTVALQPPLSVGFSRQEPWSGCRVPLHLRPLSSPRFKAAVTVCSDFRA